LSGRISYREIRFTDPVSKTIFSDTKVSAGGDEPYSLFLMTAKKKGRIQLWKSEK